MSAAARQRPAPAGLALRALSTLLALGYAILFIAGLSFVTGLHENPAYPAPGAAISQIVAYFEHNAGDVRTSIFLSFAAELFLGAFVAVSVVRLRGLAPREALVEIALFTGIAVAFLQMTSHLAEWTATFPGLGQPGILTAYYLSYGLGGPAFSLTMGLFIGVLAAAGWRAGALPGWVVCSGAVIACIGLVSWGNLLVPEARFLTLLIPLTRFPSLIWLIAAGATLRAPAVGASEGPEHRQVQALRD